MPIGARLVLGLATHVQRKHILSVLTDPHVVKVWEPPADWSPRSLLETIGESAARDGCSALIDTGALVTGLSNRQVARALLALLPPADFDAVIYLDERDRAVALVRGTARTLALEDCAVPLRRRFTFYDQVHTTGIDIKQHATACAFVTVGKDMTLRDLAQGAWRMRGLGKGQTLQLVVIPEVANRVREDLSAVAPGTTLDRGERSWSMVAWLLLRGMASERMEGAQSLQQEVAHLWKRPALQVLLHAVGQGADASLDPDLVRYVDVFREDLDSTVPHEVPPAVTQKEAVDRALQERAARFPLPELVAVWHGVPGPGVWAAVDQAAVLRPQPLVLQREPSSSSASSFSLSIGGGGGGGGGCGGHRDSMRTFP